MSRSPKKTSSDEILEADLDRVRNEISDEHETITIMLRTDDGPIAMQDDVTAYTLHCA